MENENQSEIINCIAVSEAAEILNLDRDNVLSLIHSGALSAKQSGDTWILSRTAVLEYATLDNIERRIAGQQRRREREKREADGN